MEITVTSLYRTQSVEEICCCASLIYICFKYITTNHQPFKSDLLRFEFKIVFFTQTISLKREYICLFDLTVLVLFYDIHFSVIFFPICLKLLGSPKRLCDLAGPSSTEPDPRKRSISKRKSHLDLLKLYDTFSFWIFIAW